MRGPDLSGSVKGQMTGCCEHGNERSGSIKCDEIFDKLWELSASQKRLCSMQMVSKNVGNDVDMAVNCTTH
jgi:hypothetical protein